PLARLPRAGQVAVPRAHHDRLAPGEVPHEHGAAPHGRRGAGAGVLREPRGALHGRGRVAPAAAEAPVDVAEEAPVRALLLLRQEAERPALLAEVAGAEQHGGGEGAALRLQRLEHALAEAAALAL